MNRTKQWSRFGRTTGRTARRSQSARPAFEMLEDRCLLAVGDLLHTVLPSVEYDQTGEQQGYSVAVSASYRVVGAPDADLNGYEDVGVAKVYNTAGTLLHTLNNPTSANYDYFGKSVSVSGNYVVVGAYLDDTGAASAGSAYVYDLSSGTPTTPIHTLNDPAATSSDQFGYSVSVSGNYVVVGAYQDDTGATDAGSAYVYNLSSGTPTTPIHTLNNPTPADYDHFGYSISVSGNYVVVGAYMDDTGATNAGSAYVYDPVGLPAPTVSDVRISGSTWTATPFSLITGTYTGGLPWTNLDTIDVVFDQDVDVQLSSLTLVGVNTSSYSPSSFSYNSSTFTATYVFATAFDADKLLLDVAGESTDAAPVDAAGTGGLLLNGASDYELNFTVLPGDSNGDGVVNILDAVVFPWLCSQVIPAPSSTI